MTDITIRVNDRKPKKKVPTKKDPDKGGVFEKGISEAKSNRRLLR